LINEINLIIEKQRNFFNSGKTKDLNFRKDNLKKLYDLILKYEDKIYEALKNDLNKSKYESYMTEIGFTLAEITYLKKNLNKFAKVKKVKTPLTQFKAKSYIYPEPYGVVLIISPWNYPFQLSLAPLAGAIASGNCAIIKPSEYSSNTTEVLKELINTHFLEDYIKVIDGDVTVSQNLLDQRFDYIFFTGSEKVGKIVMEKASKYLTPVTLELGGKSPCIVHNDANLKIAARRIAFGKFLNAGQTCVAPDYILVQEDVKNELINKLIEEIKLMFNNPIDYPKIINENRFNHLLNLIKDQEIIYGGKIDKETLQIAPTLLNNVSFNSQVMQEEIFGPILPIITYKNIVDVIETLIDMPKPLALYLFTKSKQVEELVLKNISFGGGCINDTIVHLATSYLPFGGVGSSGLGSYHGKYSFETFSHYKSIMKKSTIIDFKLRYPPFSKSLKILKKLLK